MQKTKQAADGGLWPNEEYAIEQYESGRDEPKRFKTPEATVEDLHKLLRRRGA